ncbi:MAG: IS1634 family transposase [Gallicola sp.]|nr:IS1634 family transposase [Gallicola sp.]
MAYFLKKTDNRKGTYLQIYFSYYDPQVRGTRHKSYRPIGYVHELQEQGIDDPLTYFQVEIHDLNQAFQAQKEQDKIREISYDTPERSLGYFPIKNIQDALGVDTYLNYLQLPYHVHYSLPDVLSGLIYARMIRPCSKFKTFHEVFPLLMDPPQLSLDQLYSALALMGNEYEKIIEIYNAQIHARYPFLLDKTYFDCTNFYFEIDREDDFRRKGMGKDGKICPLVGMGLLLDRHQIPIGMKLYPGNEPEKPMIRSVLANLKQRHQVQGKTVRVADKGLNCAENIQDALREKDGYLFSRSVKMISETEKTWVLLRQDYQPTKDAKGQILYWWKECVDAFSYDMPQKDGSKKKEKIVEKRVVTYNPSLAKKKRAEIQKQIDKAKKLRTSQAKKNEYGDCAKYVHFESIDQKGHQTGAPVKVTMNQEKIDEDLALAGYNLLVTSELEMNAKEIYLTYHNLWRIEESFRVMKSDLDAQPVFVGNEDAIKGHFLVCFLSVQLLRVLQFHVLENKHHTQEIVNFIKEFRVIKLSERKFVNITRRSSFGEALAEKTKLPINHYHLSWGKIKSMLTHRF